MPWRVSPLSLASKEEWTVGKRWRDSWMDPEAAAWSLTEACYPLRSLGIEGLSAGLGFLFAARRDD